MMLCLMRNTLTHENQFDWRHFAEMTKYALNYFKQRENVEKIVKLFEELVVFGKSIYF